MAFVQIFECRTSDAEGFRALGEEWDRVGEDKRTVRRTIVGQDRNDPDRYMVIAFFDSYESAMENSNLPETREMAGKMAAFLDAPPVFHDLDVVEDRSY